MTTDYTGSTGELLSRSREELTKVATDYTTAITTELRSGLHTDPRVLADVSRRLRDTFFVLLQSAANVALETPVREETNEDKPKNQTDL